MRYHAHEENQLGQRVIVLTDREHDSKVVITPCIGFNMIQCRLGGHETIEAPRDLLTLASRSSEFGVPLLWPPGRIRGGEFLFRGKSYAYPVHEGMNHLHGEIRMRPWRIIKLEVEETAGASVTAELRFEQADAFRTYYPHSVVLQMKWVLQGNRIIGIFEAFNEGDEEVPFGFGLHPYFKFRGSLEEVEFTAPVALQYEADADGIIRHSPVYTDICAEVQEGITLDKLPKDVDHFIFKLEESSRVCQIVSKQEQVRIRFEFDKGFPYLVVFKPNWLEALSLEPWSCVSDAYNSPLSSEWTGAAGLKAGERRVLEWSWQTESLATGM